MIRLLVVDDHPAFRRGLELMLADVDDIMIAGEAETGLRAVELAEELSPDVILMDLRMPGLDGIEATRRVSHNMAGGAGIVVLTMFEDDDSVFAAMRAGARGYLLKGTNQADIVRAVHAVGAGGAMFGPAVAQRVLDYFAHARSGPAAAFPQLSDREREILDLLAQGLSNSRIAARLSISEKTVRNHVSNIFTKLAVADRAQAVVRAREAGLGTRPTYET